MGGGDDTSGDVDKQHRRAICNEDAQPEASLGGDNCVCGWHGLVPWTIDDGDGIGV